LLGKYSTTKAIIRGKAAIVLFAIRHRTGNFTNVEVRGPGLMLVRLMPFLSFIVFLYKVGKDLASIGSFIITIRDLVSTIASICLLAFK
jgi:hypothetical protein